MKLESAEEWRLLVTFRRLSPAVRKLVLDQAQAALPRSSRPSAVVLQFEAAGTRGEDIRV